MLGDVQGAALVDHACGRTMLPEKRDTWYADDVRCDFVLPERPDGRRTICRYFRVTVAFRAKRYKKGKCYLALIVVRARVGCTLCASPACQLGTTGHARTYSCRVAAHLQYICYVPYICLLLNART